MQAGGRTRLVQPKTSWLRRNEPEPYREKAEPFHVSRPGRYIAAERVAPVIEDFIARAERERAPYEQSRPRDKGEAVKRFAGIRETLASESGITVRGILRILTGETESVALDRVDRLFVAMDCVGLFYLPPEQGGFADVYFHPAIVGDDDAADLAEIGEALFGLDGDVELREAA